MTSEIDRERTSDRKAKSSNEDAGVGLGLSSGLSQGADIYVEKLSSAPPQLVWVTLRLRRIALAPVHEGSTMVVLLYGHAAASARIVSVMLSLLDSSWDVSQRVVPLTS
jgi:hypothetical protein